MKAIKCCCTKCGQPLSGAPADTVLACIPCATAFIFHRWIPDRVQSNSTLDGPTIHAMSHFQGSTDYRVVSYGDTPLEKASDEKPDVALPFWYFEVTPSFQSPIRRDNPWEFLQRTLHLVIPAFGFHGSQYLGLPGRDADLLSPFPLATCLRPVRGAVRDPFAAFIMARQIVLERADRLCDVSNIQLSLSHHRTVMVMIPALVSDGKLKFPFGSQLFPSYFFDDFEAISQRGA